MTNFTGTYIMKRLEAILIGLAIDEHEGCNYEIINYTGRGMYGNETVAVVCELRHGYVTGLLAGYLLGKSFKDLAHEIVDNRYSFSEWLEVPEEDLDCVVEALADELDNECEFVSGFDYDSLGKQFVIY